MWKHTNKFEDCIYNHISDKVLVSRMYQDTLQLNNIKTNNQTEKWGMWLYISPDKINKWLKITWKDAQQHVNSEIRIKPQRDTMSYSVGWLSQ